MIRIDKGNPTSPFPAQQVDHVRINYDGKVIGRDGRIIHYSNERASKPPASTEEAHIPLEEWLQWSSWREK